jgi:NADH-quinone oxidoreductase subunit A
MFEDWSPILIFSVLVAGFAATSLVLPWIFAVRKPTRVKLEAYESGMRPVGTARERFSIQFYLIAMLFLLFDVEAAFLFPWAIVYRELGLFGFVEMMIFIAVVMAGFVYVWKKGALEWER